MTGLKQDKIGGFTLMEMVVVVAIFAIITGIVVANIPQLRNKISIDLVAQSIALNIRGAQVYGIGTRQVDNVTPAAYGIHFSQNEEQSFILFYSETSDDAYGGSVDCSVDDVQCVEKYALNGAYIESVCLGNGPCSNPPDEMDILYVRPSSEATFFANGVVQNNIDKVSVNACSTVNVGECRLIEVWRNGQISVDK